jgi:hypothetical protein
MNTIFVIDKKGKGPLLGYTQERFTKMESALNKSGYRKATIEEVKAFKNIVLKEDNKEVKGKRLPVNNIDPIEQLDNIEP